MPLFQPVRLRPRVRALVLPSVVLALASIAGCRGARKAPAAAPSAAPATTPATTPVAAPVAAPAPAAAAPAVPTDSAAPKPVDSVKKTSDSAGVSPGARPADTSKTAAPRKKPAAASRPCVMDFSESPPETRLLYSRVSEGVSNSFIGGGFVGHCQGENNRLRADSAEQFQAAGIVNLYGNVVYEEPNKVQITATHATYFTREGRLYADGNVVATQLPTRSTFAGPSIEYFRSTPERPQARLIAPARSVATLIEKDSAGRTQPPTSVAANRFEETGDSLLMAWGDVQIDRESINASADSASFDKLTEKSRLIRTARIVNRDAARRFTLVGDTIDMYSTARQLDRVVARHKGIATSDELVLNAETIDMRLVKQQLSEAFAFGKGRAKATTPQQDVVADSLWIRMADKQVREVRAIGSAVAIGTPDTLRITTKDKDVLRGDSVLAFFDSSAAAVADTVNGAKLREIRALGNASSLFHLASSKGKSTPPAINYVRGVRIFVNFDTGAVRDVRVDSAASGVYLEPAPDSLSDSTASAADRSRAQQGRAGDRNARPTKPAPSKTPQSPSRRPPGRESVAPERPLVHPISDPDRRP